MVAIIFCPLLDTFRFLLRRCWSIEEKRSFFEVAWMERLRKNRGELYWEQQKFAHFMEEKKYIYTIIKFIFGLENRTEN